LRCSRNRNIELKREIKREEDRKKPATWFCAMERATQHQKEKMGAEI
jgi:hypothetical protein